MNQSATLNPELLDTSPLARFPASTGVDSGVSGSACWFQLVHLEMARINGDTLALRVSHHHVVDLQLINTQRPGDEGVGLTPLSKKNLTCKWSGHHMTEMR
jgi:hypothetical protein